MTCSVLEQGAYITLIALCVFVAHQLIKELTVGKLCLSRIDIESFLEVVGNIHDLFVEIPLEQHIVRNVGYRSVKLFGHTYIVKHIVEQLGYFLKFILGLKLKTLFKVAVLYFTGNRYHCVHRFDYRLCDKHT